MIKALSLIIKNNILSLENLLIKMSQSFKKRYNFYSIKSIIYGLECLELVKKINNKYIAELPEILDPKTLIKIALEKNSLILMDGKEKGVLLKYSEKISTEDPSKIFILFEPSIDIESFFKGLKQTYSSLLLDATQNFVYIPVLREETCRLLRISDELFDCMLRECAHKYYDKLELVRAPQRFGLLKEKAKFGKPLTLNGNKYYLIRII